MWFVGLNGYALLISCDNVLCVALRKRAFVVASIAVGLTACSFAADYDDTRFRCNPGDPCPDGQMCMAGFCERGGETGDPDGGPGEDGTGACRPVTGFMDDFSSDENWELVNLSDSCDIAFDEEVELESDDGRCLALSDDQYRLDGPISIEAVDMDDGLPEPAFGIQFADGTALVALRITGRVNVYRLDTAGQLAGAELAGVDFDEDRTEYRFWRFRPINGGQSIRWDTSPDGEEWVEHGGYDLSEDQAAGCVRLQLEVRGPGDDPSDVTVFDNLNVPRP